MTIPPAGVERHQTVDVPTARLRPPAWFASWIHGAPRLYRLGLLVAAAALLYVSGRQPRPADNISLDDARSFFPAAQRTIPGQSALGGINVLDGNGRSLGLLLTTSPHTDDLVGYSGPNNLLIGMDPDGQILGVNLLSSGDTPAHVDQVRDSPTFWPQFAGSKMSGDSTRIEAVSGSTLTSLAMAEAVERRIRGDSQSRRFPSRVEFSQIRELFPTAQQSTPADPRQGWYCVRDEQGSTLGFAVRTSPYSDNVRGYQGPSDCLLAIDPTGRSVTGLLIGMSYDTPEYVARVREDRDFHAQLAGRSIESWSKMDFAREKIEGVSGATQTSFGVAEGIRRRMVADQATIRAEQQRWTFQPGLLFIIAGGLILAFSPLRTNRYVRTIWQGVLILVFACWVGDLLSVALLAGWARHGVPWRTAPVVVLLVMVALVTPWTTRRQIYCQQLCPHGAVQSWLGQFRRLHIRMDPTLRRRLSYFPAILLGVAMLLAVFAIRFDLTWLEPFDSWVLKGSAVVSATVAVVGLVASVFVPQAYCRYGCPTGELLRMLKSGGSHDAIRTRDRLAGVLLVLIALVVLPTRPLDSVGKSLPLDHVRSAETTSATELTGRAFGTTWSVKLRHEPAIAGLHQSIKSELERIESSLSHWRAESYTAQFNSSETTLEIEQPAELVTLVARGLELSRKTAGAYDITIAPLVDAWGFGPSGPRTSPPSDSELQQLLGYVGWEKLRVDLAAGTLQKQDPRLQIDLGSLLQGHAADRMGVLLDQAGVTEYLIEVGGELLAKGSWLVAIEDPAHPSAPLRTFSLENRALATSGAYRTTKLSMGETVHHLISPQTGRPVPVTAQLFAVAAPSACEADAWATALLSVGLPDALRLADENDLPVLSLDTDRRLHVNSKGAVIFGSDRH